MQHSQLEGAAPPASPQVSALQRGAKALHMVIVVFVPDRGPPQTASTSTRCPMLGRALHHVQPILLQRPLLEPQAAAEEAGEMCILHFRNMQQIPQGVEESVTETTIHVVCITETPRLCPGTGCGICHRYHNTAVPATNAA
jgi:hypothetical protein